MSISLGPIEINLRDPYQRDIIKSKCSSPTVKLSCPPKILDHNSNFFLKLEIYLLLINQINKIFVLQTNTSISCSRAIFQILFVPVAIIYSTISRMKWSYARFFRTVKCNRYKDSLPWEKYLYIYPYKQYWRIGYSIICCNNCICPISFIQVYLDWKALTATADIEYGYLLLSLFFEQCKMN